VLASGRRGPVNSDPEAGLLPLDLSGHEDHLVSTVLLLCVKQHEVTTRSALDSHSEGDLSVRICFHRHPAGRTWKCSIDYQDRAAADRQAVFRPAYRTRLYAELLKRLGNLYRNDSRHRATTTSKPKWIRVQSTCSSDWL